LHELKAKPDDSSYLMLISNLSK